MSLNQDSMAPPYLAHSQSVEGHADTLAHHLCEVARLAEEFARPLGMQVNARFAGLLHDLGKYGDLFQMRLVHPKRYTGVDHWSAGAWAARACRGPEALQASVAGHHLGLPWLDKLRVSRDRAVGPYHVSPIESGEQRSLSDDDGRRLMARFKADGLRLPAPDMLAREMLEDEALSATAMLDARMLFSCLVDADYLATEAHFLASSAQEEYQRPAGPLLQAQAWLEMLLAHVEGVAAEAPASADVKNLRADLLEACLQAASQPPGLYTLTAPTGSGKTLAMLAFALAHAQAHGLRRVVTVIPYLTIIEQTVAVYRKALAALGEANLDQVVLEHHSLAGEPSGEDDDRDPRRLLTQNWDAPLVVTTSVRFFESLFANRPGACRKLHRLAGSVILLDEVQTLPSGLASPTLATLARLAERFGATVVMATATQPAFGTLDKEVRDLGGTGWQPREIAPPELGLFDRVRRVTVRWPDRSQTLAWADVAQGMREAPVSQALGVVNLKRHAVALFQELEAQAGQGVLHLSTNLCPAHRQVVLGQVRQRLGHGLPCLLVSTQCIEAGVDLDMPVVWRAWGPLEAMAQAAGRCNRGGRLDKGKLVIFRPEPEAGRRLLYPDGGYQQAAQVAQTIWEWGGGELDLDNPQVFTGYYQLLYQARGARLTEDGLWDAILRQDYPQVAAEYKLIAQAAVNVLVPYQPPERPGLYDELVGEARQQDFILNRAWLHRARPLAVSLFRPTRDDQLMSWLEPLRAGRERMAEDWFILRQQPGEESYHPQLGLIAPQSQGLWVA